MQVVRAASKNCMFLGPYCQIITGTASFDVGERDGWLLKLDATTDIQFVPGNNLATSDTTFVGTDTSSVSATTTVNPDTTVVNGNSVVPTVSDPSLSVATQSQ